MDDHDREGVRSLERGLRLLAAMNADPYASVTHWARQADIPRATAYRLLDTFVRLGFVAHQPMIKGYRLTKDVRRLSDGFIDEDWLTQVWPELLALGERLVWPVSLFTSEAGTMVIRQTTHDRSVMSIDYGMTGKRMPITETAAGRAYLAFCPTPERELILSLPNAYIGGDGSAIEREILDKILAETRQRGFGSRVGGLMPKTASLSVPVVARKRVLCCLSVIWIASAMTMERAIDEFQAPMNEAARRMAKIAS